MKMLGTPGHALKHIEAVTNRYGLRKRGDSSKPNPKGRGPAVYLWPIEGEQLTIDEICARFPGIKRCTIISRINHGDRTWAKLGRPVGVVTEKQLAVWRERERKRELFAKVRAERRAAYAEKLKGHADLK